MISYLDCAAGRGASAMPAVRRVIYKKSCDRTVSEEDTMIATRKVLYMLVAVACLSGGAWAQVAGELNQLTTVCGRARQANG